MGSGVCAHVALGVIVALGFGAGCGGGGSAADGGPPDAIESICPVPEGSAYVLAQVRFLPADQGFDLDGDEQIDNELGNLPESVLESMHDEFDESIRVGDWIMIMLVTEWSDPPTPTDEEVGFHVFGGRDADIPLDPSNNHTGDGEFVIYNDGFDLDCNSQMGADEASLVDGVLTATKSEWKFVLATGVGTMDMANAITVLAFDSEFRAADGEFGGALTLCSLSAFPFPGETEGMVLDAFVNDPVLKEAIAVDTDVDGDGLEEVVGDGVGILECIDGDGTTVIPGRDCPCHPAIADAYSLAWSLSIISARITAVRPHDE